jgi:GTPase
MAEKRPAAGPTVVLVGRPNVGKSTLFNRITGSRRAIVTPVAGTTRDTIAEPAEWQGTPFSLVDTGGMFGASTDPLHELVVEHGRRAIRSADVIVFVVDGREGLVSADEEIAGALRAGHAPVVMAVNKTDDRRARGRALEFYRLGFEPVIEMAAEHGEGVGDLLDEIVHRFPPGRRDGHRRPSECRQVVASESSPAHRAIDRQRSSWHHPRHG